MVSVVVVGPAMSGKTHLCLTLAGVPSTFGQTCCASYLSIEVNDSEWHIWDTPRGAPSDMLDSRWLAKDILLEADVVLVCHDAQAGSNPMQYVRACGASRCIIVLTRGTSALNDLSYFYDYLTTSAQPGKLVPIVHKMSDIFTTVAALLASRPPVDSPMFFEIEL